MSRAKSRPNIPEAIRRSRRARAALRSRRRRFIALAAGACLVVVTPLSFSIGGFSGDDVVNAAVSQAQSLAALLDQRSPGERTQGVLTKSKRAAHALAKESQPAIAAHLHGQPAIVPPVHVDAPDLAELVGQPVAVELLPTAALVSAPPSLGTIIGSAPGASVVPPGGGTNGPPEGSGPVSFPTPQPRETIDSPSAVPEPGTWALMLLGFGLTGWRLRRAKITDSMKRLA
jgi:hypothetical protein